LGSTEVSRRVRELPRRLRADASDRVAGARHRHGLRHGRVVRAREPGVGASRARQPEKAPRPAADSAWARLSPFIRGRRADLGIALLLAAVATWGFSQALSRQYTFDAIVYAWQIEQFGLTGKLGFLFHPHHLLFNLVGFLWWRLIGGVPGFQRALAAQQMLSAVAGGAAVALCYVAARQATGSRLLALALALVMGAGLGLWMIATDGGIYALGLALCAATLWLAMRLLEKPGTRLAIALGAVAAAAALIHQMHFLLAPAVAAAPLLGARTQRQQVRLSLATLGTYAALLSGTYLLAAKARGCEDAAAIWRWLTLYGQDGRWWDFHIARNLGLDLQALIRAFTADPGRLLARLEALGRTSFIPIAAGLAALLLLATLYRGRQLLLCVLWLIPYAAFFTVWVPGYPSYWVPMAFGLLLVAALLLESGARALQSLSAATQRLNVGWRALSRVRVLNLIPPKPGAYERRTVSLGALVRAGALGVCCLAAWELAVINRPLIQWRRHEGANPYLVIARAVETHTRGRDEANRRASDLVLIAGTGYYASAETYIPYFARRNLVTLASALKQYGPGSGRTRAEAIEWLRARIRRSWKLGAQVYVFQDVLGSPVAFDALDRRYGMTLAEAKALLRDFALLPSFSVRGEPVYRLTPETPAIAARPTPGESPATGERHAIPRVPEEPRRSIPGAPGASNRAL
jgi:hypothetical protein